MCEHTGIRQGDTAGALNCAQVVPGGDAVMSDSAKKRAKAREKKDKAEADALVAEEAGKLKIIAGTSSAAVATTEAVEEDPIKQLKRLQKKLKQVGCCAWSQKQISSLPCCCLLITQLFSYCRLTNFMRQHQKEKH